VSAYSLRRRLLAWLLLATAVLGLLALADTWREATSVAEAVSDRVLAGSALAIAERVAPEEAGGLQVDIPFSALEMLASTAEDQVFYRVDGPGGAFLTGYEALVPAPLPEGAQGAPVFADGRFDEVPIRIATLSRRIATAEGIADFTVTVAESTRARAALARAILWRSAFRLMGMILGAAAIVWVTVTFALRPLDRLGDAIALRSPGDLGPLSERIPEEVEGLVSAMNSFMARLERALAALRNFTGNASHQLRTPLAALRAQLALLSREADPAQARAIAEKADAALVRAERVLAQLLMLARVDAAQGAPPLSPIDLARMAREAAAEAVPAAARAGIDLGYEGAESAFARAEPVLVAEMLRNLIDNAIAYAGPGAVATVRALALPDGVRLEIEDDGPGLPPARRRALAGERALYAGAEAEARPAGLGLGLAIVREIAGLFGASLALESGISERGLRAVLIFPPTDTAGRKQGPVTRA
jgi:two-component system sensor histidine kinase TctE